MVALKNALCSSLPYQPKKSQHSLARHHGCFVDNYDGVLVKGHRAGLFPAICSLAFDSSLELFGVMANLPPSGMLVLSKKNVQCIRRSPSSLLEDANSVGQPSDMLESGRIRSRDP